MILLKTLLEPGERLTTPGSAAMGEASGAGSLEQVATLTGFFDPDRLQVFDFKRL